MAYVITQTCCKDASCVPVCPVDCIRPTSGPGQYTDAEMLYIDPVACIDCGACLEECPVDAIYYEDDLPPELDRFRDINMAYFERHPLAPGVGLSSREHAPVQPDSLRVAIVGSGPAACYLADELLRTGGVQVDLFERLPTPFGLIRAGVAPDHQHTKSVVEVFEHAFTNARFGCHLNVEVGRDISHDELLAHYHAVVYGSGASKSRDLGIPGEDLVGNHGAADFVAWYNGHPDHAADHFDLSGERAVIVGNGNVALDVARMLLMEPSELARTDIAEHALKALSHSSIREVVILGRRLPRHSAFSVAEFLALGHLPGIDVIIDSDDLHGGPDDDVETTLKLQIAKEYAARVPSSGNRRIVFRYLVAPTELVGTDRVQALRVVHNRVDDSDRVVPNADERTEMLETPLVLRSIGYKGSPIEGLHFDTERGVVPNDEGRVLDPDGETVIGVYVTGWIKRGPRGVIGTNRTCAQQTAAKLWEDFDSGKLSRDIGDPGAVHELLKRRGVTPVDWQGWRAIDDAERRRGAAASRPRVKFVDFAEMLAAVER